MTSPSFLSPIKIGLCGATGKMGQAITQIAKYSQNQYEISATYTNNNIITELRNFCQNSEIIVDFSSPEILPSLIETCINYNKGIVIGTTGLTTVHFDLLNKAACKIPILYSVNMSIGANLITHLASKLAASLSNDFDVEIVDYHHRYKKDVPSGTALMLGQQIAKVKNLIFEKSAVFTRNSDSRRNLNEIGFSSIRGGNIPGEHEVIFAGNNEIIKINHQILNREVFAVGALVAASWLNKKVPGFYSMIDVIELNILASEI